MHRIKYVLATFLAILLSVPACALVLPDETRYPVEDGEPIYKVYELARVEQIAEIPREDISYNGQIYRFSDVSTEARTVIETQEYMETVHRGTALTNDPASILAVMEPELVVTTEDGFTGTAKIDPTTLTVEPETYGTSTRTVTLTRTYPSMAEIDVALIPQTVTENGLTYSLSDCAWAVSAAANPYDAELSDSYTATAVYTATRTSKYPKTYSFSVDYNGTLQREHTEGYCCIAVFEPAEEDVEITRMNDEGSNGAGIGWKIGTIALGASTLGLAALHFLGKGRKKRW